MIGCLRSEARRAFDAALSALAICADEVAQSGSSMAGNYVHGAAGNLRHALACLAVTHPHVRRTVDADFDQRQVGESAVVGSNGRADTVLGCLMPDGARGRAVALLPAENERDGVWLRPDAHVPGLHVRGFIERLPDGYRFLDEPEREAAPVPGPGVDLGRDLLLEGRVDLSGRPAMSAALEVALASGSWVHLGTGDRWYADLPTARALVRSMRGRPVLDASMLLRLGVCVDREALLLVEGLGWRQWPTPGLED